MSYLVGNMETTAQGRLKPAYPSFGAFPLPPSPEQVKTWATQTAANVTPTGLLWMAPKPVQEAAKGTISKLPTGADANVASAQAYLMQLQMFPGPVSGVMDPNTQQALDTFRSAVGFPTGGGVTQQDLSALQQAVSMMSAGGGAAPPVMMTESKSPFPPWALPVGGAVVAGLVLMSVMKK